MLRMAGSYSPCFPKLAVWVNLPPALGTPVVRHPGPEESGQGLEMIDALSEDWGWESVPGWKGKRVWAVLLAPGA
jgi:hypothetical protein